MIHHVECSRISCDNCGTIFSSEHDGFSIFIDDSDALQYADNDGWYLHGQDPEHEDKHYCSDCFQWHETEDDKIIVDETRLKIAK